jgi:hypothetical protein
MATPVATEASRTVRLVNMTSDLPGGRSRAAGALRPVDFVIRAVSRASMDRE